MKKVFRFGVAGENASFMLISKLSKPAKHTKNTKTLRTPADFRVIRVFRGLSLLFGVGFGFETGPVVCNVVRWR